MNHAGASQRMRIKRVALGALGVLVLVLVVVAFVALRTPAWYQPPIVPVEEQQRVRNHLIQAEQAFTKSLLAGEPFIYHIYQDDLNRWLAMRKEIYPRVDELIASVLTDLFAIIEPGNITLAGRLAIGRLGGIVSIDIEPAFRNQKIILTAKAIRHGSLPLPLSLDELGLRRHVDLSENRAWPGSPRMHGSFLTGFEIEPNAWWRNGGIDYLVTDLAVREGRLDLTIQPLGRHARKQRNIQWSDDGDE